MRLSVSHVRQAYFVPIERAYNPAARRRRTRSRQRALERTVVKNREKYLKIAADDNDGALEIAKIQFDEGRIDLLSVLQIQARLIGSRSALIFIRYERLAQRVNLHLALGGSFEQNESLARD